MNPPREVTFVARHGNEFDEQFVKMLELVGDCWFMLSDERRSAFLDGEGCIKVGRPGGRWMALNARDSLPVLDFGETR